MGSYGLDYFLLAGNDCRLQKVSSLGQEFSKNDSFKHFSISIFTYFKILLLPLMFFPQSALSHQPQHQCGVHV